MGHKATFICKAVLGEYIKNSEDCYMIKLPHITNIFFNCASGVIPLKHLIKERKT